MPRMSTHLNYKYRLLLIFSCFLILTYEINIDYIGNCVPPHKHPLHGHQIKWNLIVPANALSEHCTMMIVASLYSYFLYNTHIYCNALILLYPSHTYDRYSLSHALLTLSPYSLHYLKLFYYYHLSLLIHYLFG